MANEKENYSALNKLVMDLGGSLFGVADIRDLKDSFVDLPPRQIEGLDYGISVGVRLSKRVIEGIDDRPTQLYFHHYRQLNNLMDQIAVKLTGFTQKEEWDVLPIAASQIIDWENQKAHISHKRIAVQAGLGFLGRNNLLVNPKFGSRVRLVTLLTNMPLSVDGPLNRDCGDCRECIPVCPVGAIKERQEDFDHLGCFEKLRGFRKECNIGQYICGVCIKACSGVK
jgi:epoxyqueuosine reductase QueG